MKVIVGSYDRFEAIFSDGLYLAVTGMVTEKELCKPSRISTIVHAIT